MSRKVTLSDKVEEKMALSVLLLLGVALELPLCNKIYWRPTENLLTNFIYNFVSSSSSQTHMFKNKKNPTFSLSWKKKEYNK